MTSTGDRENPQPLDGDKAAQVEMAGQADSIPVSMGDVQEDVSAGVLRDTSETPDDDDASITKLAAQGFTSDEVLRLIRFSGRLVNSRESRESEATLRRLRFTRWLIEHGKMGEFSA